jgi:hypothetical protein
MAMHANTMVIANKAQIAATTNRASWKNNDCKAWKATNCDLSL